MAKTPFDRLVAVDIMERDVITVSPSSTLQEAMSLLIDNHVTGLPVMDKKSRCVGVISATDILGYEQEHAEFTSEANSDLAYHFDADTQRWESVRVTSFALEEFGEVRVEEVMARELLAVTRKTPLPEVARMMITNSIHRVLVMNDRRRLYGVITSVDFVRLFVDSALPWRAAAAEK